MPISADTTKRPLTASQQRAIEAIDKWVAVVAGAGSGKTTVLIDRCLKVLKGDPSNINHLLAITFTEKAAAQLISRMRQNLPASSHHVLTQAWVGTFHAICARLLRNNAPLVHLDPLFTILDENAFHLLSQQIIHENFISLLEKRDPHAVEWFQTMRIKKKNGTKNRLTLSSKTRAPRKLLKSGLNVQAPS